LWHRADRRVLRLDRVFDRGEVEVVQERDHTSVVHQFQLRGQRLYIFCGPTNLRPASCRAQLAATAIRIDLIILVYHGFIEIRVRDHQFLFELGPEIEK